MKLLGSNTSPYVRKVRVVMAEKKIEAQYELVDVNAPDSPINDSNPLGKIPCLIMDDGGAVFDSRVIVEYLDNLTPVHRLIPPNGRSRVEVRTWEALADGLLDAALLVRAEQTQRAEGQRSPAVIARQMGKIERALAAMSAGLADKPWCADGKYSLADIAVGCALGYLDFRFPQLGWRAQFSNLSAHADKLFARPSFADTRPA
ncbi:glutathione S-transferase N-terminal domain-containing protein [Burkholderiaceae bacterium FT117]|uniref:glutathione S-transferase N-terminal domain-containing protein n=1 Tax=Zeimonas sediminis TaxID=2944268 RepID=UPI00234303C0|nr:glutathione S-transferase N-terminal domain-containing protein [Zeimonas sediminis]MCM5570612.1 glutathione S-transferase N-terminal domain-containing protein [Zeimonas sediminis]